jgi:hypothetical protein
MTKILSPDLNDRNVASQDIGQLRPSRLDPGEQGVASYIAKSDPEDARLWRSSQRPIHEIAILIMESSAIASAQMSASGASARPASFTCRASWPFDRNQDAKAGGS